MNTLIVLFGQLVKLGVGVIYKNSLVIEFHLFVVFFFAWNLFAGERRGATTGTGI